MRIATLVRIAANNGSSISSEELRLLLSHETFVSASELERFVLEDDGLRNAFVLREGELAPKGSEDLLRQRLTQRDLTDRRVVAAQVFLERLTVVCPWIRLAAISGSTAYGGTKPQDDIDFFIVTRQGRLWVTLFAAMIVAKVTRLRDASAPVYCFNRVIEENRCADAFRTRKDPLFAREALILRVLHGRDYYRELLREAGWMEVFFPALYRTKKEEPLALGLGHHGAEEAHGSLLNALAFLGLAPYLWLVGLVRNAKLDRMNNTRAKFRTVIQRGFCAYESQKYEDLREEYAKVF